MKLRIIALLLFPLLAFSQAELRIGEWRNQIPYNSGRKITQSDEAIFYATDIAILRIQKSDLSTNKISTIEGLSGSKINAIYYHKKTKTLVVAYSDGLIDLLSDNGVMAIPFIKVFNNVPISKEINSISYKNEESVFINSDFGFLSLNLISNQVEFTVFTNVKINSTVVFENQYYSATSKGLFSFDLNSGNLIEDFSNWKSYTINEGLDNSISYAQVLEYKNELYVLGSDMISKLSGSSFIEIRKIPDFTAIQAFGEGKDLIVSMKYNFSNGKKLFILIDGNQWTDFGGDCVEENLETLQEPSGRVWLADNRNGFRYLNDFNSACSTITIPGPFNNNLFEIKSLSDGIYVASGGWDETFTYLYRRDGIYTYKNKTWDFINEKNNQLFKDKSIFDVIRIEENKSKSKIFYASFQQGLIVYNKSLDKYELFNDKNSNGALLPAVGDPNSVRLSGLDYDYKNDKLWISNYLSSKPLVSLDALGNWKSFTPKGSSTQIINITVDQNGYKWLVFRDGVGVFDDKNTDIPDDDRFILLNSSNTNITSNIINNVTVDIEGDVWVGTGAGPIIFECSSNIFDGTCKGTRRKVDQNGIIGYLLESEEILSVAVDGANRKWIGTRKGLYVQSPSGEFQVAYFNTENSPLLSNNIFSLAINESTGEVWIGTDRGIQVYRSNASFAPDNFTAAPIVYPNPVTADYLGPVAIKGLARDARVKITDLSGRLVYETFANGGQAIWDRRDYLGNEVSSGIYLIFANTVKDFDVSEGIVSKLVLTR